MKLLQAIIAVLTVILFLTRQKVTFAEVNPTKKCVHGRRGYCDDSRLASSLVSSNCQMCRRCSNLFDDDDLSMHAKYKKDPKITVDNEYIGDPVEN